MAERTMQSSKYSLLTVLVASACLFAVISLLHRDLVRTVSDYILLAAFCAGVLSWTMMSVRLRGIIGGWSLVAKALCFAGALLLIIVISTVLSRMIETPLAVKLFGGALPLAALVAPTAFAVFGNGSASKQTEDIKLTER